MERSTNGGTTWSTVLPSEYTLKRLNGSVVFASAQAVGTQIRIDGQYLPMSSAAYAYDYSYSRNVELLEVTPFLATYKKRIPGIKHASGKLSQFDLEDSYFIDALTLGSPIVIEFKGQTSDNPQRVWAILDGDEIKAAVESVQSESISFISTDELLELGG